MASKHRLSSHNGMSLTGDWRKLRGFLANSETTVEEINAEIRKEAEALRDDVKKLIPFYSVPNAKSTISHKGGDTPLFETGGLEENIDVFDYNEGAKKQYYIVKGNPDEVSPRTGLTYEILLDILEEGTHYIPPRPILSIATANRMAGMKRGIVVKTQDAIKRRLSRS